MLRTCAQASTEDELSTSDEFKRAKEALQLAESSTRSSPAGGALAVVAARRIKQDRDGKARRELWREE